MILAKSLSALVFGFLSCMVRAPLSFCDGDPGWRLLQGQVWQSLP